MELWGQRSFSSRLEREPEAGPDPDARGLVRRLRLRVRLAEVRHVRQSRVLVDVPPVAVAQQHPRRCRRWRCRTVGRCRARCQLPSRMHWQPRSQRWRCFATVAAADMASLSPPTVSKRHRSSVLPPTGRYAAVVHRCRWYRASTCSTRFRWPLRRSRLRSTRSSRLRCCHSCRPAPPVLEALEAAGAFLSLLHPSLRHSKWLRHRTRCWSCCSSLL